jgi:L-arabinose transport system substrate-binding protein
MKRQVRLGALFAVLAVASAACSGSATPTAAPATAAPATAAPATAAPATAAPAADVTIYGMYKRMDQGWFQNEAKGAEAQGTKLGAKVVTLDNQFDPNVMSANLDNAIAQKASGIIMVVPDQKLGPGVIDKAKAAGIPLIAVDDSITGTDGTAAPFVGMNTAQIGKDVGTMLATFATDRKWFDPSDASSLKVAALTFSTLDVCNQRTDASKAAILAGLPGLSADSILAQDYEGANTDGGLKAMQGLLTANPDVKHWLVYSCNEEGVVGGVRALEAVSKDADSCGVGLGDGALAKIEMLEKKSAGYCGSLYVDSRKHGAVAVQELYDFVTKGTPIPQESLQDGTKVTADNAAEVFAN